MLQKTFRTRFSQKGFTLVELLCALVMFLMIAAGIQMFMVSSLASIGRQGRVEMAEDLGEIVSSQVARDNNNFNTLNSLLTGNRASYLNSPLAIDVFPASSSPIHPSALLELTNLNALALRLGNQSTVDVDLLVSPVNEAGTASTNQLLLTTRVRWRRSAVGPYTERTFRRILSRDFNTY